VGVRVRTSVMLRQLASTLTPFEHSEVLDFPEIWYYGAGATKIKGMPWAPNNHGAPPRRPHTYPSAAQ
jgi:hypothetical protein